MDEKKYFICNLFHFPFLQRTQSALPGVSGIIAQNGKKTNNKSFPWSSLQIATPISQSLWVHEYNGYIHPLEHIFIKMNSFHPYEQLFGYLEWILPQSFWKEVIATGCQKYCCPQCTVKSVYKKINMSSGTHPSFKVFHDGMPRQTRPSFKEFCTGHKPTNAPSVRPIRPKFCTGPKIKWNKTFFIFFK